MDKITEHNDSLPFFEYVIISWVQCDYDYYYLFLWKGNLDSTSCCQVTGLASRFSLQAWNPVAVDTHQRIQCVTIDEQWLWNPQHNKSQALYVATQLIVNYVYILKCIIIQGLLSLVLLLDPVLCVANVD